jgi:hypothetical protein
MLWGGWIARAGPCIAHRAFSKAFGAWGRRRGWVGLAARGYKGLYLFLFLFFFLLLTRYTVSEADYIGQRSRFIYHIGIVS